MFFWLSFLAEIVVTQAATAEALQLMHLYEQAQQDLRREVLRPDTRSTGDTKMPAACFWLTLLVLLTSRRKSYDADRGRSAEQQRRQRASLRRCSWSMQSASLAAVQFKSPGTAVCNLLLE